MRESRGSSSRGRSQFTKAAIRRAIETARETGVDRVEVEIPGGSKIVFKGLVSKQVDEKPEDIVGLLK
jgi:hypothetical protein